MIREFLGDLMKKTFILILVILGLLYFTSCIAPSIIDKNNDIFNKAIEAIDIDTKQITLNDIATFEWDLCILLRLIFLKRKFIK